MAGVTLFSGIDLAADPAKTGIASIHVRGAGLTLTDASLGASDTDVARTVGVAELTGIDIPLGWPRGFREVINAHAAGALPPPASTGPDWRRGLANRFTDLEVRRIAGVVPLSVAADRIAHPALRWMGIEARLRADGLPTNRDGSGRVAEVYPAAALKMWGLPHRGYKGDDAAGRIAIMAGLASRFDIDWAGFATTVEKSADVLDAVIAALVAHEVRAGRCLPIPADNADLVAEEGWIWVPRDTEKS
ncbi:hypothetical protein CGLAU_04645 [Corynebacterium glaucum]|uniref:DUF429 domain-containing protein n=1 Tax=Corynebacterium glaucum TaxID=187491 RepID=A0A1Q2HVP0_9CORY|nr:DUF429 domain-containing protein [Corynebacterium glaucum]AQQ14903.1 hypothetical protein CGLAU_04645 [Corynebacterium glaucum]